MAFEILILIGALFLLSWAANLLAKGIDDISAYLSWKPFVIAFFVMAIGSAIPNLFLGLSSAVHGVPELSFGDMIGNNMVSLTLVIALTVLLSGALVTDSRIIQTSAFFTMVIVVLPLLLIADGSLGRGDGLALILVFLLYTMWVFSKRKHFAELAEKPLEETAAPVKEFKRFLKALVSLASGLALLVLAAEGIVRTASSFAFQFEIPIAYMGILVTGMVNALPEAYFAIIMARKKRHWIVLGGLLGAIMVPATMVVGTVALLQPIEISEFSLFAIGRAFLLIAALLFLIFVRTADKVTKKEGLVLLFLYLLFVGAQFYVR